MKTIVTQIHSTALVDPRAALGHNVVVGPFCIVEEGAVLGNDCTLEAKAIVRSRTTLGCDNSIGEGAVIGGTAQHLQLHEPGGTLTIGNHNRIRENVTIHRGWANDATTVVKDNNLLMVSSHVGHDCQVGSHCILVNHVLLGGFVQINDGAYLGGASAVVQHCRIGRLAMIGAMAKIAQDVPPYVTVAGSQVVGLNRIGLRRHGFTPQDMLEIKAAYRVIYREGLRWNDVLAILKSDFSTGPAAAFSDFLSSGTRGFVHERLVPRKAALKFVEATQENGIVGQEQQPLQAKRRMRFAV
jgi:UDP-N-acetylglucosamine acyltransferase